MTMTSEVRTDLLMRASVLEHYSVYTNQGDDESVIECDRCRRKNRVIAVEADWDTLVDLIHLVYEHEIDYHQERPPVPGPRLASLS